MHVSDQPRTYTAFAADRLVAAGPLPEVARAMKPLADSGAARLILFDDETGRPVDLDFRGSIEQIVSRLAGDAPSPPVRGRPRLGVTAREVTLLPRHWEWLAGQPGGASAALRRLVEQAMRSNIDLDRARTTREAAYRAMSTLAGNLPGFEDAARALFAANYETLRQLAKGWPIDIRNYVLRLADRIEDAGRFRSTAVTPSAEDPDRRVHE